MPKRIDWLYSRKSCQTCKKVGAFVANADVKVAETVDATKVKMKSDEAIKLFETVEKIVAARGKYVVTFDLKRDRPTDEALLAHTIGPTGNLRAPTAIVGNTLVVGFHDEAYRRVLGV